MAIKSAYELAMERANSIKVDKNKLKNQELETKGKEAASSFLNKPKYNFKEWIDSVPEETKKQSFKGAMWAFTKNINLPMTTADIDKLLKIQEGIKNLTDKQSEVEELFTGLMTAFQQYIDNSKTLLEQCKEQFAPRLQQKAMQIAQQTGQMVPIDPETDRDFIEFQREQQKQVDDHYKEYISQVVAKLEDLI